ncbi:MAG TPA: hypothetical protein VK824_01165, partial [Planctomycetota bacterium]|nr:hypothetical protein [Planctomycetota bacterium]
MDSLPATDSQPDALPHRTASLLKRTLLFGSLQFVMLVTRARPPPGRRRARAPGAVVKPALLALC